MKRVSQMEEMIKKANELFKESDGRDEFNQASYLMGVIDAITWARHNEQDGIQVNRDTVLEVD